MKSTCLLPCLATMAAAAADIAFVGNYGATIETLSFDTEKGVLSSLSSVNDAGPGPSWQELSADQKFLYTVEEKAEKDPSKGAISSYSIGKDGRLSKASTALGLPSPVSLGISPDQKLIFTANYGASGASVYSNDASTGEVKHIRDWTWTMDGPGAIPDRQDSPHPHQALFDHSGKYVIIPDLGADLIRRFSVNGNSSNAQFTELEPVKVTPATGPRHGAFYPPTGEPKFYYLVGEIGNTVTVFSLSYGETLEFKEIQSISTLPDDYPHDPDHGAASEIAFTLGDGDVPPRVYVSNRLDSVFPNESSMASYTLDPDTGKLTLLDIFPCGVVRPRHFSIHPSETWLISEGEDSNNIGVLKLDKKTGKVVDGDEPRLYDINQPICLTWL